LQPTRQNSPHSIFTRAGQAIKNSGFSALALCGAALLEKSRAPAVLKAVAVIARRLCGEDEFRQSGIALCRLALTRIDESDSRNLFVTIVLKHADALADPAERVAAYGQVARYARLGSALEWQAAAGILKHADALADPAERVAVYRDAACYAREGTLNQQALAGFVKHADALADPAERVAAYWDAARYAGLGSALERQASAGFLKHADTLADPAARIAAYEDAARDAPEGSAFRELTLQKLRAVTESPILILSDLARGSVPRYNSPRP
jgi:alkylated DNA nucleotide flippase Atl1